MVRLIGYCYSAIDYLDERDAKFVADMAKIVERYPVTAKQKKWLLDILNRLLRYGADTDDPQSARRARSRSASSPRAA